MFVNGLPANRLQVSMRLREGLSLENKAGAIRLFRLPMSHIYTPLTSRYNPCISSGFYLSVSDVFRAMHKTANSADCCEGGLRSRLLVAF